MSHIISEYAHPVTQKVWMYKKPIHSFYTDPIYNGGDAEIFEDGTVIIFDEDGIRVSKRKFRDQDTTIIYLKNHGWKVKDFSKTDIPSFMKL